LTATVALLTGAYHLSRRKTQRLLWELFGISVSLGAISAMEQRARLGAVPGTSQIISIT